jgi:hypothetical protein
MLIKKMMKMKILMKMIMIRESELVQCLFYMRLMGSSIKGQVPSMHLFNLFFIHNLDMSRFDR